MSMSCEQIREMLPAYGRGDDATLLVRRHLARCAACRAEAERYEALRVSLSSMAGQTVEAPPGLMRSLASIPERAGRVDAVKGHLTRNRKAYAGGIAAAVAVAGAAAWRSRSRSVATA